MAELAYADASKASVRKDMRVRVPLPAPTRDNDVKTVGAIHDNELMYPPATVELAKLLSDLGTLDRENAAICGVSIRAIRHWRAGDRRAGPKQPPVPTCPRCHGRALNDEAYAYLLGLYLGDGHITHGPRSYVLWVACSDAWPGLLALARQTVSCVMPSSSVFCASQKEVACTYVKSVSKHWPCLFPQHGPGRKHERAIVLEAWQQEIVTRHPGDFARGLFHSDGCRLINRVRRPLRDGDRWYEYPRYLFVNRSADIHRLCGEALDRLGVAWRFSKPTTISVARREAVARLDEFVGPKY
jgi:hypothetical protein